MRRRLATSLAVLLVVGCFPITVSVGPDGRIALVREEGVVIYDLAAGKASVVAKPTKGEKAAWAAFSSDGKKLMYVLARENGPGDVYVAKGDGSEAKKIYRSGSPMAYATWSPDGKYIGTGEVSNQTTGDLGNLVNVKAVNVDTGEAKSLAPDTTQFHAWTPDSKGVVAFAGQKKSGDEAMRGQLTFFALDGSKIVLAEAATGKKLYVDVSPDGKDALLTAGAVVKPMAGEPEAGENVGMLYRVNIATKEVTKLIDGSVASAVFSPDGKHILAALTGGDAAKLSVCDPDGKNPKVLAEGILTETEGMDSTRIIPTWLANDEVVYWRNKVVIGTAGKAITAERVKIDGSNTKNLQADFESLLAKE